MGKSFVIAGLGMFGDISAFGIYLMQFAEEKSFSLSKAMHLISLMPTSLKVELWIFNIFIVLAIIGHVVYSCVKRRKSHAEDN